MDVSTGGGQVGSKASSESRGPGDPDEGTGATTEGGQEAFIVKGFWLIIQEVMYCD